jgi:hypothetical protein
MRNTVRARLAALTALAAAAGSASAGAALLVRAGFCVHRVLTAAPMPGMTMDGTEPDAAMSGPCPILLGVVLVAAALFVFALLAVRSAAVEALAAAVRLLAPGSDAPWALAPVPVLVVAGAAVARRRPPRAPPARA